MRARKRLIITFLFPATFLYLVFFLYPAIRAFYYSFFDWSGFSYKAKFIGLDNYRELIRDDLFIESLKNTLTIVFVGGVIVFGLAFALTILLNSGIKGRKLFRAIIFLPNVVAVIALTTMWSVAIYHPRFGILKNGLAYLGFESLSKTLWTSPENIFESMLAAIIWMNVGFYVVLLMAGIDKIPPELYEAARIDGANELQMFYRITVPLLWDVITVGIVLWSISALKIFEFPFAFSALEPSPNTYTIAVYLYVMGFGQRTPIYRLGYATAMGVALVLTVVVVVVVLRRVLRREVIQY
ncbi:MAG: sugar ABC transporter permease [Anaerolineae bacterium]|nr:MAG: sugar ABC transporter permease [Anaerolineae bacterium]